MRTFGFLIPKNMGIDIKIMTLATELEQWNTNIAFAQVNLSPLADHKPGNWLFPV